MYARSNFPFLRLKLNYLINQTTMAGTLQGSCCSSSRARPPCHGLISRPLETGDTSSISFSSHLSDLSVKYVTSLLAFPCFESTAHIPIFKFVQKLLCVIDLWLLCVLYPQKSVITYVCEGLLFFLKVFAGIHIPKLGYFTV